MASEKKYIELEVAKETILNYIGEQTVSKYPSSELCRASRMGAEGAMYELEYAPTADVVETKRISEILAVLFENNIVEKYIPNTANAGSWEDFLRKACSGEYGMLR